MSDAPTVFPLDRARRIAKVVKQVEGLPVDLTGGPRRRPPDQGDSTGNNVINKIIQNGIAPQRVYSITRSFRWDGQNGTIPDWADVVAKMGYHTLTGAAGAGVIKVPYTGTIVGSTLNYIEDTVAGHTAGRGQFRLINVTTATTTDATGPLASEDEYAVMDTQAVSVTPDDAVFIQGKWLFGGPCIYVRAEVVVTVFFEEQFAYEVTGDARTGGSAGVSPNGIYILKGQFAGRSAIQRIDAAFWIWWDVVDGEWIITPTLGVAISGEWFSATLIGAYTPLAPYTGTPTVAAYP